MPLSVDLVGAVTAPVTHDVDARWLMAYAAGLGDANPRYFDTSATGGIVGHPLFAVCVEWDAILAARSLYADRNVALDELRRGVHANHDLHIHRLVRPGDLLTTTCTITGLEARPPGAYMLTRLDTMDANGEPVATTWQGSLYLGVDIAGPPTWIEEPPAHPTASADHVGDEPTHESVEVVAGAAHVYTECARIWNPIHTDAAVAFAAGLPEIILHGTATHALGVSRVVDRYAAGDPQRVRRLVARFGAMVPMPQRLTVVSRTLSPTLVELGVLNEAGQTAVRDGLVELNTP